MEAQPQQDPYRAYHEAANRGIEAHISNRPLEALFWAIEAHKMLTVPQQELGHELAFDPEWKIDLRQGINIENIRQAITGLANPTAQDLAAQNLRNIGVRLMRLAEGAGDTHARAAGNGQAKEALRASADIHNALFETQKTPDLKREAAVTAMYLGNITMNELIDQELNGQEVSDQQPQGVLDFMHKSLEGLEQAAEIDGQTKHQYLINAMGRFAMAEALYGSTTRAVALGARATLLAFSSEKDRSPQERSKAVAKALARGLGALAVGLVARVGLRNPALHTTRKLL